MTRKSASAKWVWRSIRKKREEEKCDKKLTRLLTLYRGIRRRHRESDKDEQKRNSARHFKRSRYRRRTCWLTDWRTHVEGKKKKRRINRAERIAPTTSQCKELFVNDVDHGRRARTCQGQLRIIHVNKRCANKEHRHQEERQKATWGNSGKERHWGKLYHRGAFSQNAGKCFC